MTTDQSETIHQPVPLTECITGTLTLTFPGATVRRRMSLADGHTITQINGTDRSGDRLAWHHTSWIQWEETKVLAGTFDTDEDLGWGLKPEDRATLRANGHPHGVLRSLLDHWTAKGIQPAYSPYALQHLHAAALTVTADEFGLLADYFEGEDGSRALQAISEGLAAGADDTRGGTGPSNPDDGTEPGPTQAAGRPDAREATSESEADAGPDGSGTAGNHSDDGPVADAADDAVDGATTRHDEEG